MMLWTDWSLTLSVWSANQTGGRLDKVNRGWHGVNHTESTHRHSKCQMTAFPHAFTADPRSPRTRRLKKMVMPLDCSSCWACSPVCTGRMGLAGVGRTSFVVTTRVVWRVTLKPSWVVLGNLLENIKSNRIKQRKKGPELSTHAQTRQENFGTELYGIHNSCNQEAGLGEKLIRKIPACCSTRVPVASGTLNANT